MPSTHAGFDLTRTTLAVLFIIGILSASLWILRPFVAALIWASMVVVATWPVMQAVQRRLWGQRWLAVVVMTIALLLVFVVPLSLALGALVANGKELVAWVQSLASLSLPHPPDWVGRLPIIGAKVVAIWTDAADSGPKELAVKVAPYAQEFARWFALEVGGIGLMAAQFLLTVAIAAILYAHGEAAVAGLLRFSKRLAGNHGEDVIVLAGQAIRGVALGVVVTAVAQSALTGIGLLAAGVPLAFVLTAVAFILAVAQIGPFPVLLGSIGWLYWQDQTAWAIALLIWSLLVGSMDNVLRPYLIRKGADLPLLLIFAGVIGGLLAFGLVGIFVGPLVLAVAYTLTGAWIGGPTPDAQSDNSPPPPLAGEEGDTLPGDPALGEAAHPPAVPAGK